MTHVALYARCWGNLFNLADVIHWKYSLCWQLTLAYTISAINGVYRFSTPLSIGLSQLWKDNDIAISFLVLRISACFYAQYHVCITKRGNDCLFYRFAMGLHKLASYGCIWPGNCHILTPHYFKAARYIRSTELCPSSSQSKTPYTCSHNFLQFTGRCPPYRTPFLIGLR